MRHPDDTYTSFGISRIIAVIMVGFVLFVRNAIGVIQTPYQTCRELSKGNHFEQLIPIFLLITSYFVWSSLVHHGISSHPFLLTFSFSMLFVSSIVTYGVVIVALSVVGKSAGGKGGIKTILLPWSYSLLPTVLWFYATSLLWFLFPPPRTLSPAGQLLSFVFIAFSLFLFFWKGVLYYLTLRFGMRLGLWRIVTVSLIVFPLGFFYSLLMYRLGIFRVPFI